MKNNRRNYYRILQVQPEAPAEIIKASYRALMTKLRHHPDLGGDHETAVLINEAYSTLIDPDKRAIYDRTLRENLTSTHPGLNRAHQSAPKSSRPDHKSNAEFTWRTAAPNQANEGCCHFCGNPVSVALDKNARCYNCGSPIAPLPPCLFEKKESAGRRSIPRVSKNEAVSLYQDWRLPPSPAQLVNISPIGLSVITSTMIPAGYVIKVSASGFDAVAKVVSCRLRLNHYVVHMRFLSVIFSETAGGLVSITV